MNPSAQFPGEQSAEGEFERQDDAFRELVTTDGSSPYRAAAGRYHLYISLACPWASRTLIVRNLKGFQDAVGVTVVDPIRDERGWAFRDGPGHSRDPINRFAFLSEAYIGTDRNFDGRVTVPVLWDKQTRKTVNNKASLASGPGSGELAFVCLAGFVTLFRVGAGRFCFDAMVGGRRSAK